MYPEQPPNLPKLSPDYLDQIAPQQPKKIDLSRKQWFIVGISGSILIFIIGLIVIGGILNKAKPTEVLAAKLQSTVKVVDDASSKIKSSSLRALNGNLKIYLTNTVRDIEAPLNAVNVDVKKLSPDVVKAESSDKVMEKLEDARLNNKYDRIYATEMSYRLSKVIALMEKIYKNTGNGELKSFLENAYKNLEPTQQQFAAFDETSY